MSFDRSILFSTVSFNDGDFNLDVYIQVLLEATSLEGCADLIVAFNLSIMNIESLRALKLVTLCCYNKIQFISYNSRGWMRYKIKVPSDFSD
jgi:hypothetical protein